MTLIHIGANKAISTTLQKYIFKENKESLFLGVNSENNLITSDELYKILNYDDHLYNPEILKSKINKVLKLRDNIDKKLFFSSEDVSTSPILNLVAKRLTSIFPNPEILIIIRDQKSAIKSFYKSHGAFNRPSPTPYFKWHLSPDAWWRHYNSSEFRMSGPIISFNYYLIIKTFMKFLSKDKIHILVYEELIKEKDQFSQKLSAITHIAHQKILESLEKPGANLAIDPKRVFLNMLTCRFLGFSSEYLLKFKKGYKTKILNYLLRILPNFCVDMSFFDTKIYESDLYNLYAPGNQWIDKNFELKLSQYGYIGL